MKLNIQLIDKMYKEKAEEIFKCIPMKMESFYEKFDKECMNVPIFKYYDVVTNCSKEFHVQVMKI